MGRTTTLSLLLPVLVVLDASKLKPRSPPSTSAADHLVLVMLLAWAPVGNVTAVLSTSFELGVCLRLSKGAITTVGNAPFSTTTCTESVTCSPALTPSASEAFTEKMYAPGASANGASCQSQDEVSGGDTPQMPFPDDGVQFHRKVITALGSSGSAVVHALMVNAESAPTVRSPPLIPPRRGSSRNATAVSAKPHTSDMHPVARRVYLTPLSSDFPATYGSRRVRLVASRIRLLVIAAPVFSDALDESVHAKEIVLALTQEGSVALASMETVVNVEKSNMGGA